MVLEPCCQKRSDALPAPRSLCLRPVCPRLPAVPADTGEMPGATAQLCADPSSCAHVLNTALFTPSRISLGYSTGAGAGRASGARGEHAWWLNICWRRLPCGGSVILAGLTFNVKQDLGLPVQMQDNEPTSRLTKSVALAIIYFFLSV